MAVQYGKQYKKLVQLWKNLSYKPLMAYMQQLRISHWKFSFDVFLNDAQFDIYLLKVQNINTNMTKCHQS